MKEAAKRDVGTTVGTVAAGNDSRIVGTLQATGYLFDLTGKAGARNNFGLGSSTTYNEGLGMDRFHQCHYGDLVPTQTVILSSQMAFICSGIQQTW